MGEEPTGLRGLLASKAGLAVLLAMALLVGALAFGLGFLVRGFSSPAGGGPHAGQGQGEAASEYTCSMHPQIRQPGPGACPVCGMDLISVESGGSGEAGPRQLELSERARALAEIEVAAVRRQGLDTDVRLTGKVDYDETRVGHITAWVEGRIDRLFVDFTGERVKRGQSMASIYSPQLLLAQDELIQASKMVASLTAIGAGPVGSSALEETLQASRERLLLWGLTKKQVAAIEKSGKKRKHLTLTAPMGGVVIEKHASQGMYVDEGTRIYTIADLRKLWIMLDAYESDLALIRQGQEVDISVEAHPGRPFEGVVAFIDPVIDPVTRTARIRVEVDNADGLLKPEMFVSATVLAGVGTEAQVGEDPLVIPASAPLLTGKRAVVYVEISPGLYEGREVVLGPRVGDHYVVLEGLEQGEKVVVRGNFKIDSAMQILAKPSMMSPEGGVAPAGHHHGPSSQAGTEAPGRTFDAPPAFLDQLAAVVDAYLALQEALAGDDVAAARSAAAAVKQALTGTDMKLLEGPAHMAWMESLSSASASADGIASAADIEAAREDFLPLSMAVIDMVRSFGSQGDRVLYLKYCPMAFGNTGASWLQAGAETRNPYFGAKMLTCAEDRDTIHPAAHGSGHD